MRSENSRRFTRIISPLLISIALMVALSAVPGTVRGQDGEPTISFSAHPGNPILQRGDADAWDGGNGLVFAPQIVRHGDLYYMFYTGADNDRAMDAGIGYATSPDGITWTKSSNNPILTPSGAGYDAMCISVGVPLIEPDGTWVLYYAGNAQPCYGPGSSIMRATAPGPDGPWQREYQPHLMVGRAGEWDSGFLMPQSVIRTDDGYVMYYAAGTEYLVPLPRLIGMATSPDGVTWTKYDNPATTAAPFAQSDPISEYDRDGALRPFAAWATYVMPTETGWEMIYSSTCPDLVRGGCPAFLSYAVSADGIRWTTYTDPMFHILNPGCDDQEWAGHFLTYPFAMRLDERTYRVYFTGCTRDTNDCQIGMATGTITWSGE